MAAEPDDDPQSKRLVGFGTKASGFWIIGLVVYLIWTPARLLALNDIDKLGTFLQGAFAPLAFFWFVITVKLQIRELQLQREELYQTRKANELQAEEMRHSVEQLKDSNLQARRMHLVQDFKNDLDSLARDSYQQLSNVYLEIHSTETNTASRGAIVGGANEFNAIVDHGNLDDVHIAIFNGLDRFIKFLHRSKPQLKSGTHVVGSKSDAGVGNILKLDDRLIERHDALQEETLSLRVKALRIEDARIQLQTIRDLLREC